jgi:hypothetical protein
VARSGYPLPYDSQLCLESIKALTVTTKPDPNLSSRYRLDSHIVWKVAFPNQSSPFTGRSQTSFSTTTIQFTCWKLTGLVGMVAGSFPFKPATRPFGLATCSVSFGFGNRETTDHIEIGPCNITGMSNIVNESIDNFLLAKQFGIVVEDISEQSQQERLVQDVNLLVTTAPF